MESNHRDGPTGHKKPRTPPPATKNFKSPIQKTPTVKAFGLPDVPPGEDAASFERHNRVLKAEFSKPSPNVANVKQLMEVTFPMRRREILSIGHTKDYHPFTKYPFLQIPSHVRLLYN